MRDDAGKKGSILVVDDDPEICSILTEILSRAGYSCDEANNGPSAIEMAQDKRYDIALVDLLMPGLSGKETIARIKSISPGIAIAVISIVSDELSMKELFDAGASVYIRKPFKIEEVIATVEDLILGKRIAP